MVVDVVEQVMVIMDNLVVPVVEEMVIQREVLDQHLVPAVTQGELISHLQQEMLMVGEIMEQHQVSPEMEEMDQVAAELVALDHNKLQLGLQIQAMAVQVYDIALHMDPLT